MKQRSLTSIIRNKVNKELECNRSFYIHELRLWCTIDECNPNVFDVYLLRNKELDSLPSQIHNCLRFWDTYWVYGVGTLDKTQLALFTQDILYAPTHTPAECGGPCVGPQIQQPEKEIGGQADESMYAFRDYEML